MAAAVCAGGTAYIVGRSRGEWFEKLMEEHGAAEFTFAGKV